ncbi:MAG TPA: pectate lyase [Lacunisphaera sp.]|nr:pectate lyase [Lacunisphaera sp.]
MMTTPRSCRGVLSASAVGFLLAGNLAWCADAPKPWPPDAFRPVTAERIARLPGPEQAAWRQYLARSAELARSEKDVDLVDHSPTTRVSGAPVGASYSRGLRLRAPAEWFASEEARRVADHVVTWQTPAGGWVKGGDYARDKRPSDQHHDMWSFGTFDNDSTIFELQYLAKVISAVPAGAPAATTARAEAWRGCFARGIAYTLAAQYPNGGFPQIYPLAGGYHDAITFNDDAMVHVLELLRGVADRQHEYGFVGLETAAQARQALERGIRCVLATQVRDASGRLTIWGQQHDAIDLTPCAARNFEPISLCSSESVGLVEFLMSLPDPSPEVIAAVDAAVAWFPPRALHDVAWNHRAPAGTGLEPRPGAPLLWARYYELGTDKPIFGERNRMVHYTPTELTLERRNGYGWFNERPAGLVPRYAQWKRDLAAAGHAETAPPFRDFHPALPVIPDREFRLTDFGAIGDGHTLNTDAFRRAIAAVREAGGGRLVVPKGEYRTLPFELCSRLDLHLEEGAVIEAPASFGDYGLPEPDTLGSQAEVREKVTVPPPLIHAHKVHDVALTGTGAIDGNGARWWAWAERAARAAPGRLVYPRPHLVVIDGGERLLVADVTLRNSSRFHLVPQRVNDLTIERVKVRAPSNAPNTDAIDPGPGRNFLIRDCDIDTGDDDIVIKSGGTNVLIENNTIKHGHGISIGSETIAGVDNMLVRNCTFENTDNGIRIKSMRGAGGLVHNVRYENIRMRGVANAILLQLDYIDNNRPDFKGDPARVPAIHDIVLQDVTIENSRSAGRIVGLPDSRITGVTLRNVRISAEHDLVIKDADEPRCENVTREIKPGIAPPDQPGEH